MTEALATTRRRMTPDEVRSALSEQEWEMLRAAPREEVPKVAADIARKLQNIYGALPQRPDYQQRLDR
ncbi:MAG TPA: hypothetical protein VMZ92_14085, partial [Planctomycetota bacterium]|nr:hypothetical protein [Planctomycetota bacterium]